MEVRHIDIHSQHLVRPCAGRGFRLSQVGACRVLQTVGTEYQAGHGGDDSDDSLHSRLADTLGSGVII